mmetsp:Transcript_55009/g.163787  ORF Transcript_55009/g.163787 Transcript_55009/m.163787 type:complete len:280 (+) Transcript_55009:1021-1860(+)
MVLRSQSVPDAREDVVEHEDERHEPKDPEHVDKQGRVESELQALYDALHLDEPQQPQEPEQPQEAQHRQGGDRARGRGDGDPVQDDHGQVQGQPSPCIGPRNLVAVPREYPLHIDRTVEGEHQVDSPVARNQDLLDNRKPDVTREHKHLQRREDDLVDYEQDVYQVPNEAEVGLRVEQASRIAPRAGQHLARQPVEAAPPGVWAAADARPPGLAFEPPPHGHLRLPLAAALETHRPAPPGHAGRRRQPRFARSAWQRLFRETHQIRVSSIDLAELVAVG